MANAIAAVEASRMTIALPLRLSETELGSVVDANGNEVFVVDVHRELDDEEVLSIALHIVAAANAWRGGE